MDKQNIILDLCGGTGAWSKPYEKAGFEIINITLPDYDITRYIRADRDCIQFYDYKDISYLKIYIKNIYGILAAPPCTMFSYARTNAKVPRNLNEGMRIVEACLNIIWHCLEYTENDQKKKPYIKFWALENPNGMLNWFLGKPAFMFDPYEFGDGYSKKTCLWGYFNEPKKLAKYERTYNKTFDKLLMSEIKEIKSIGNIIWKDVKTRQEMRSITPYHFAEAFYKANSLKEQQNG